MIHLASISVVDSRKKRATIPLYFPDDYTADQIASYMQKLAFIIQEISEIGFVEASLTIKIPLPNTIRKEPLKHANRDIGGLFSFTSEGQYPDSVRIPAILPSLIRRDHLLVNGQPDVENFVAALTNGLNIDGVQVNPSTRSGFKFVRLNKAKYSNRRK